MPVDFFKHLSAGVDVGQPPTIKFGRKVVMTNSGSTTANRTITWTDPDASVAKPVASIAITGSDLPSDFIENISDLTQTSGTADWNSGAAVTTADHNKVIPVTITDDDGNTDTDSFTLEVYTLGTTKITVDQPEFEFCVGDDQTMKGLWIDNNIDRIEISVDGGTPFVVPHTGFQGGEWTWAPSPDLTAGTYNVTATIYDLDGTPNTDTVNFLVTICNDLAEAPTITFDQLNYAIDLPIGASNVFTGTLEAPGANPSEPLVLTMQAFNVITQQYESITGTFSGFTASLNVPQSWTWTTTNLILIHELQNLRVTLTQDQNAAQATADINFTHIDPLQLITDHPCDDPNTSNWEFFSGLVPSVPAWSPDASDGGNTFFTAVTGWKGGVLIGDDPISLKLTASSSDGTDKTYTPQFQIYTAGFDDLIIESYINGVLQERIQTLAGPIFNSSDATNFNLAPLSLFDGDEGEIRLRTQNISAEDEMSFWTFSNFLREDNSGSGEPPDPGVYVDSAAAAGGDGSFELPFNNLNDAKDAVGNGEKIFLKRGSVFTEQILLLRSKIGVTVQDYGDPLDDKPVIDGNNVEPFTSLPVPGSVGLLEFDNCQSCTAKNIRVINSAMSGLVGRDTTGPSGSYHTTQGQNIHFLNCEVDTTQTWGLMLTGFNHSGSPGNLEGGSAVGCTVRNACVRTRTVQNSGGEAIHVSRAQDILIEDCEVWDHAKEGIVVNNGAHNVTVRRCHVHDRDPGIGYGNSGGGVYIDGSSATRATWTPGVSEVLVEGCVVTGDGNGMMIASENGGRVGEITIRNNLLYDNTQSGFAFTSEGGSAGPSGQQENISIIGNTISQSNTSAHVFLNREDVASKLVNLQVSGNIIARTVGGGVALFDDDANLAKGWEDWNILWNGGNPVGSLWNQGDNSVIGDPDFESIVSSTWPGNTDYYPSSSSPAVDFLPTTSTANDIAGTVRPKGASADAGCYERV